MATYAMRYYDPVRRAVVDARIEARSEDVLRADSADAGRIILQLRHASTASLATPVRAPRFQVATWCRELATLLKAGMTAVEALETLAAQAQGTERETVHAGLLRSLQEGRRLSRAMQHSGVFPAVLVASVTASERTGTLTGALDDYLRYDEMLGRLARQAISAAIYPVVVAVLGFLVASFLLLYVIPRFSRMYVDFQGPVSMPTRVLMTLSGALHEHLAVVVGALVGVLVVAAWACRQGRALRMMARLLDSVAPLRRQWDHFRYAKLYQALALMFRGGYTLDEALAVSAEMGLGTRIDTGIARARDEIARGRAVAHAFGEAGLTDDVSRRLLAVGERSGGFDTVLQAIADRSA
ncbi:MAG: type II secretion system F family protein, partial [Candidatus Limnocylindrales bacterium]